MSSLQCRTLQTAGSFFSAQAGMTRFAANCRGGFSDHTKTQPRLSKSFPCGGRSRGQTSIRTNLTATANDCPFWPEAPVGSDRGILTGPCPELCPSSLKMQPGTNEVLDRYALHGLVGRYRPPERNACGISCMPRTRVQLRSETICMGGQPRPAA